MATVKLATLVIRVQFIPSLETFPLTHQHPQTIAKPISAQLRNQAKQHDTFRNLCISLAQKMHTAEISLRTNILGEPARHHIRPLSETKAIENGANALAESFLFAVAAALILGETYRTSSKQSKRRDDVDEKLDNLLGAVERLQEATTAVEGALEGVREEVEREQKRREALERVVERLVGLGKRGGGLGDASVWEGTPLSAPRVGIVRSPDHSTSS
ncbi:optic atrophy 3 protein-domain-containing protein [Butyriboletus roseoflavus]|nr:optic atrophy 3 protein-domain-containing protein [Butyriboletus roseoflavus]